MVSSYREKHRSYSNKTGVDQPLNADWREYPHPLHTPKLIKTFAVGGKYSLERTVDAQIVLRTSFNETSHAKNAKHLQCKLIKWLQSPSYKHACLKIINTWTGLRWICNKLCLSIFIAFLTFSSKHLKPKTFKIAAYTQMRCEQRVSLYVKGYHFFS